MEVTDLTNEQVADIFNDLATSSQKSFGRGTDEPNTDLTSSITEEITQASTTETTTASTTETTTVAPDLTDEPDNKPGRKPKYNFTDTVGYFEDRVKTGKFLKIEEEIEGEKKLFIPKTPEEMDEFFEIQINTKLEQKYKETEQQWYQSKSPAWQAVAKYAEMVDDPSEVLPFIQGVKTINSVKDIDEKDIEGAEKIIRIRLQQRGEPDDIIEDQIDSLKTTDKLIATATKFKPMILQDEAAYLQERMQEAKIQQDNYIQMVSSIREKAIETIESPFLGKQKLKNEEKAVVYDLIAAPSVETGGYKIYNAIDNLFEKGDFKLLAKVALLIAKEEALTNYLSLDAVNKNAQQLERKLRVSGQMQGSGAEEEINDQQPVVQRRRFDSGFKTK